MKTCSFCKTHYTKVSGMLRQKSDFGYCSIDCMISDKPPCPGCGKQLSLRPNEIWSAFAKRRFCSQKCGASYHGSLPKSPEHLKKIGAAKHHYYTTPQGQTELSNRSKKFSIWLKTPEGRASRKRTMSGYSKWRQSSAGKAWQEKMTALKQTPEYRKKLSEKSKNFYKTGRGKQLRKKFKNLYSGKARPKKVTEKMRQSLLRYRETPEGIALAARQSLERTDGFPDAPYGPNWERQRRAILKRDKETCQICKVRGNEVHHIVSRRKFHFVPGQNTNFLWANDLNNLIVLCKSCHRKVEMKTVSVQEPFLAKAQSHYKRFKKDCVKL